MPLAASMPSFQITATAEDFDRAEKSLAERVKNAAKGCGCNNQGTHMPNAAKQFRPQHQGKALTWSQTDDAGRKWYSRKAWIKGRQQHLQDNPYCVECVKEGKPLGMCIPDSPHVDHIRPHRGVWNVFIDSKNWQTLCSSHHARKTQREQQNDITR